jgi:hypothetical protein
MVELGAFWSFWTIVFGKKFPKSKSVIVEGDLEKLSVGLTNLYLNGLSAIAYHKTIAVEHSTLTEPLTIGNITLTELFESSETQVIDILHMDIQGAEFGIYEEVAERLENGTIKNVIMATHFIDEHDQMLHRFLELDNHWIYELKPGYTDGELTCKEHHCQDCHTIISSS